MLKKLALFTVGAIISAGSIKAQVYADRLIDYGPCPQGVSDPQCLSTVVNPQLFIDNDLATFATLTNSAGANTEAFIEVGFPVDAASGNEFNILISKETALATIGTTEIITVLFLDENGDTVSVTQETKTASINSALDSNNVRTLSIKTPQNPAVSIHSVRISLSGTAQSLDSLNIYECFYLTEGASEDGDRIISAINVSDTANAIDGNDSTFALLNIPFGIADTASLWIGLPSPARGGDMCGFEVGINNSVLSTSFLENISFMCYDANDSLVAVVNDFSSENISLFDTVGFRFQIAAVLDDTVQYEVSSIRLVLNPTIGVTSELRCYRAFILYDVSPLIIIPSINPDSLCVGSELAELTVESGFTNYRWSTGATSETIITSSAGKYSVLANSIRTGALKSGYINLKAISLNLDVTTTASAVGEATGSATINVTGGSGNYEYLWSNDSTGATIDSIAAGIYSVEVTDIGGGQLGAKDLPCTFTKENIIVNDDCGLFVTGHVKHCSSQDHNGAIYLSLLDVVSFDTIALQSVIWNDGAEGMTRTGLSPGTYSVEVTSSEGCKTFKVFRVLNAICDDIDVMVKTISPSCGLPLTEGSIDISVNGGSGSYSYEWENGAVTEDRSALSAGIYHVIITDNISTCQTEEFITLNDAISVSGTDVGMVSTEETCAGDHDATVTAELIGATSGVFQYNWSTGETATSPFTTATISNLGPGVYTVQVIDQVSQCESYGYTDITVRESLAVSFVVIPQRCENGEPDGAIGAQVSGGREPYTYLWSNGDTTANIIGLTAGDYTLTLQDFNGCTLEETITVVKQGDKICNDTTIIPPVDTTECLGVSKTDIFNVLTPNADGKNDTWYVVEQASICDRIEVQVFNRYGDLVFQDTNYTNDWGGSFKDTNEQLPDGTYFYLVKLISSTRSKELKGYLEIITK